MMVRGRGFTLAALGVAFSLALSCSYDHYDEAPEFVEQVKSLKAEVTRKGQEAPTGSTGGQDVGTPAELPKWFQETDKPVLERAPEKRPLTLDELFANALQSSYQLKVFADLPLIRETGLQEAEGAFDFTAFVKPQYDHINEPVGSTLVSRTSERFVENEGSVEFGVRKRTITGAELSIADRLADKHSSADFFVPGRQATSTFTVRLVQPLLSGAGTRYNSSVLHLAGLDGDIAEQELFRQVESHLLEIARAYWVLYSARAVYALYARQSDDVKAILDELKARANADALQHQILRAESALTDRRADLVRAEMGILNAQERIRALINEETGWSQTEIIPTSPIHREPFRMEGQNPGSTAVEKRPEVKQAFLQLRAAAVRLGMNENELMPRLNLILEGRLAGLAGKMELDDAFRDQRHVDEGGGLVGLLFEMPLGNSVAEARQLRREIEMRQQFNQLRTTVDTVLLEVRISEREVEVGWRDFVAKSEAARAARQEVEHLLARKDLEAMRAPASPFILDLLSAQDRQKDAERSLVQAVATYQVAVLNLQRAQGIFLEYTSIAPVRSQENDLPVIKLEKRP